MRSMLVKCIICALLLGAVRASLPAQSAPSVFLEDHTWLELRDAVAAGTTSVLVFSGSVEESGPHLALGKHNFRARAYAERIARALGHTMVAPIIPVGPTDSVLMRLPGTLNVQPEVFAAYNEAIVRSLAAAGFKYVFLLGDHGGDQAPLRELAPRLDAELAPRGARVFFVSDGYAKSTTEVDALAASKHLIGDGHGGLWDTAELWAVAPNAVRPALFAAGDTVDLDALNARGMSGDPRKATPQLGREFGEIRVRNATAQISALLIAPPAIAAATASDDRGVVAALDTQYQAAVKSNDGATMSRILADDFVLVVGRGTVFTKTDLLKNAENKDDVYEHQEDTLQAVRQWGNTAVVTALLWLKGKTKAGEPFDYKLWFSDTYVRTPAGWKYVFGQASIRLPAAP